MNRLDSREFFNHVNPYRYLRISMFRITNFHNTAQSLVSYHSIVLLIILLSFIQFFSIDRVKAAKATNSALPFLIYYDQMHGIKIQYPSDWTVDEREPSSYDDVTKIVGFIKNPNELAGNFLISMHNLSKTYKGQTIGSEELLNHTIDYYKNYYRNFEVIDANTNVTLGNSPNTAYRLIWIDIDGQYTIKNIQMETMSGNAVYIIRYYAESSEYAINLPLIHIMIDSLKIMTKPIQGIGANY